MANPLCSVLLGSFGAISLSLIAWSLFEEAILCFNPIDHIPLSLSSSFFGLPEGHWDWDDDDFCNADFVMIVTAPVSQNRVVTNFW